MTTTDPRGMKDQLRAWTEENPLRRWRVRQHLTMMDASVLMETSLSSIQQWEQGGYEPNGASMQKMAETMGVKLDTLQKAWRSWYASRPGRPGRAA